jgi:hypothetical protein
MASGRPGPAQHFIYPLTERGGYSFDGRDITPENYWKDALAGATVEWGMSTGYRLIARAIGCGPTSASPSAGSAVWVPSGHPLAGVKNWAAIPSASGGTRS